jgi:hypothetical protein
MPDDIEYIEEGMKFKDPIENEFPNDLDTIEKRINKLQEKIENQEEELMTIEQKINMLGKIFPLSIGDRVRNLLSEDGIVEMVGLDDRGVLYLIKYKEQNTKWESEHSIKKNVSYKSSQEDSALNKSSIKTDIEE